MRVAGSSLLVLLGGCALDGAPAPTVRHWGTLREALRDGRTEARVDVAGSAGKGVYGVGAAAGLDGEITIVDGEVIVSRVRNGRILDGNGGMDSAESSGFVDEIARSRSPT